jgi:hypothetical protein
LVGDNVFIHGNGLLFGLWWLWGPVELKRQFLVWREVCISWLFARHKQQLFASLVLDEVGRVTEEHLVLHFVIKIQA